MKDDVLQKRFTRYLQIAVQHKRIDYLKRQRKYAQEKSMEDISAYQVGTDFADCNLWERIDLQIDLQRNLKSALEGITVRDYKILCLRLLNDKSFAMIAEQLGMSNSAAIKAYRRAVKRIKNNLKQEGQNDV